MNNINTIIKQVEPNSIGEELGIQPGDILISINDTRVEDIIEYRFLINDEFLNVVIKKPNGDEWELDIEKDYYEDLGIEFEDPMLCDARSCKNKCIFCFIDQNPKGMRESIYFKDDDSRLSFLQGNYISMTNLKQNDINKIIKYRISPLNISVHTTNPDLRIKMLNNKDAGKVLDYLKIFVENGITLNAQIVLCYDVNDRDQLDRTLDDLAKFHPYLKSISVVPVGLTKYRQGLYNLIPFDKEKSRQVIRQVEAWQKVFKKKLKTNLVYLADEFYINADIDIAQYKEYEDFPQIENGVGMLAKFEKEFYDYIKILKSKTSKYPKFKTVSTITGECSFKHMEKLADELEKLYPGFKINVHKINNDYFGHNVTVTGLLTGQDIINQLKDKDLGEVLVLSENMLRQGEEVFLDDTTIDDLKNALKVVVVVFEGNGKCFINTVLGIH